MIVSIALTVYKSIIMKQAVTNQSKTMNLKRGAVVLQKLCLLLRKLTKNTTWLLYIQHLLILHMRAEGGGFTTWLSIELHSNLVIICNHRLFVLFMQFYITNTNQPLNLLGFWKKPTFKNKSAHQNPLPI